MHQDSKNRPGLEREVKTVQAMIHIYCREHGHDQGMPEGLCAECGSLLGYARERLEKCVFGDEKPTCAKCPIHCYKPDMRTKITEVMRFSGPKMMTRHPVLAVHHLLAGKKPVPPIPRSKNNSSTGVSPKPL